MDKRDRFEELFQERLQNWECEPDTEQWKTISGILPQRNTRTITQSITRTAAVIALFLFIGAGLLYRYYTPEVASESLLTEIQPLQKQISSPQQPTLVIEKKTIEMLPPSLCTQNQLSVSEKINAIKKEKKQTDNNFIEVKSSNTTKLHLTPPLTIVSQKLDIPVTHPKQRKWHLGMGGGNFNLAGISTSSSNYPDYLYNNDFLQPQPEPPLTKSGTTKVSSRSLLSELNPTKVKHSSPISFGMSISRTLNHRWSFSTGLTYSYLRNQWRYEHSQHDVLRQRLHMIGIPVSFNYRLTHWEKFYCYWSIGAACEMNITGKMFSAYKSQHQRIPGVLWTANTRIGIAYPVIRYISVYAEGGFLWNLTPTSEIQTIRSENCFNVTGQIGFRLNF